ncbi:MAG: DsbA family oxidoreductase [Gammaproteobacteria bacterium]|nr:DsbA family oxidoreductase [Gammaproteobacteria bacterium]
MATILTIDFVSDVSCPWCAIGLYSLERALAGLADKVTAEIHFQPFELNPKMPPEGQDIAEHLAQKYGSTLEQQIQSQNAISDRGAAVGFAFQWHNRKRIYNTFDAHRLLHWAGLPPTGSSPALQLDLKKALFDAYFVRGDNPASHETLLRLAEGVGLDKARAGAILESDEYADEVLQLESVYLDAGINSVPAVIIDRKYLISGGQPPDVFQKAIEQILSA